MEDIKIILEIIATILSIFLAAIEIAKALAKNDKPP